MNPKGNKRKKIKTRAETNSIETKKSNTKNQ